MRTHRSTLILILAVASLAACGARTSLPGNNNQNNGNQNQNANQNHNANVGDECSAPQDCVVAWKQDDCCPCPVAASPEELAADPCLIPEGGVTPDGCFPEACPAMPCLECPDVGRTATCESGLCIFKEGQCTGDTECITAVRVDNCCEQAFPATYADTLADPCLRPWPLSWSDIPQECQDRWDPECALIDCAPSAPRSRAVACGETGCETVTECAAPVDCALMVNTRQCCPCAEGYPASMAGHDPCIVPEGTTPPEGCRPAGCDTVLRLA